MDNNPQQPNKPASGPPPTTPPPSPRHDQQPTENPDDHHIHDEAYEFIFDSIEPPAEEVALLKAEKRKKYIFITAIIVLLIAGITLAGAIFGGGEDEATAKLVAIGLTQKELEIYSKYAEDNSKSRPIQSYAATIRRSVATDMEEFYAYLDEQGLKKIRNSFGKHKNSKIEQRLSDAVQDNNIDNEFLTVAEELLTQYRSELQSAYQDSITTKSKEMYESFFSRTEGLLKTIEGLRR